MRTRTLIAIGVAAYLASLAATLPASRIAPSVEGWTQGAVALLQPTGTVFDGSASMRLRLPGHAAIILERIEWDWHALALFRGQLAAGVRLKAGGLSGSLTVARSPLAWHVRDAAFEGPAAALSSLQSLLATWNPMGRVALAVPSLRIDHAGFTGSGFVEWRDAGLSLSAVQPLGAWRLALAGDGGPAKLMLTTQRGPLSLTGNGTVTVAGKATFSGEAKAEPGREADLAPLLAQIGPRRADGVHAFSFP